jgi:hypothetical protein
MNINSNENIFPLVIEGGFNTSYISSFLISLFYKKNNYIKELLNGQPKKPSGYYLQEIIKINFINPILKNYSIKNDVINEIRNYLIINGYQENLNIFDLIKSNKVDELYEFISDILNGEKIEFETMKLKDGQLIEQNKFYKTSLIKMDITQPNTSIREEFIKWLNKNVLNNDDELYTYELKNMPTYICFYLNRIEKKINIDLMTNIKFFKNCNPAQKCIKYRIHGFTCKSNNIFYSVFYNNQWIMFTENKIPSFEYISLSDYDIIEKIKADVIFVIYTIDEDINE